MKFSENWLREWVDVPVDSAALCHRLTMSGLEVESSERLGGGLDGVLIAEIVAIEAHPDAERLRVCQVEAGLPAPLQIVCGAPNARLGLKAPLATIGARLPGGLAIAAAKLRGVESMGMLCSARELGIDQDASGLLELPGDAPVGAGLATWIGLPDTVIELGLTPNRSDCLGLRGIAMEVAAEFGQRLAPMAIEPVAVECAASLPVHLDREAGCPRYCGRVLEGLDPQARTPLWMQERLRRAGLRPISALVDVTNYVMLELGQPLHAFDADRIQGAIRVRRARAGESLRLLDGREVGLDAEFLVIADDASAVALAGIMGGDSTRITGDSTRVFLESAHFAPTAISGRARRLGLHTDASHRFERGVDPELPRQALERASALLRQIAGGQAGPLVEACIEEELPRAQPVRLRAARLAKVLGIEIAAEAVERILGDLGMRVSRDDSGWTAIPPSWRFDLAIEEDLIEEVARIHGYEQIPTHAPRGELVVASTAESRLPQARLRERLLSLGYGEAVCFSFVEAAELARFGVVGGAIALANPLSAELAVMRTALLPGLCAALSRNRNRQAGRVRLFEIGRSYRRGGGDGDGRPVEEERLAMAAIGSADPEQWGRSARAMDFYDLKGELEVLLAGAGQAARIHFTAAQEPWLHPGRSARLLVDGEDAGCFGVLHPKLARDFDLDGEVLVAELVLSRVLARAMPQVGELSRFPSVRRDLALVLPERVDFAELEAAIRPAAGPLLRELRLFDVYRGPGIERARKSFAIGLIFQDDSRTLGDTEVDSLVASVIASAATHAGAQVRGTGDGADQGRDGATLV